MGLYGSMMLSMVRKRYRDGKNIYSTEYDESFLHSSNTLLVKSGIENSQEALHV